MDAERSRSWPEAENDRLRGGHTELDCPKSKQREAVQFMLCSVNQTELHTIQIECSYKRNAGGLLKR